MTQFNLITRRPDDTCPTAYASLRACVPCWSQLPRLENSPVIQVHQGQYIKGTVEPKTYFPSTRTGRPRSPSASRAPARHAAEERAEAGAEGLSWTFPENLSRSGRRSPPNAAKAALSVRSEAREGAETAAEAGAEGLSSTFPERLSRSGRRSPPDAAKAALPVRAEAHEGAEAAAEAGAEGLSSTFPENLS
jgi:hypothetical protein